MTDREILEKVDCLNDPECSKRVKNILLEFPKFQYVFELYKNGWIDDDLAYYLDCTIEDIQAS